MENKNVYLYKVQDEINVDKTKNVNYFRTYKDIRIPYECSTLNYICDKIYLITLKSDTRNLVEYFKKYNVDVIFFRGYDAYQSENAKKQFDEYLKMSFEDPRTHPLEKQYKRKLIRSVGAIGYLHSFRNVLQDMKKIGYKKIIVFDDDVMFNENINYELLKYVNDIKCSHLCYIGASQHTWTDVKKIHDNLYLSHPKTDGSFGVCIDTAIVNDILFEIEKFNCPLDSGPLRYIIQEYGDKCITIYPSLIIADTNHLSQTGNGSRDIKYHRKKVGWDLSSIDFTVAYWKVSILMAAFNASQTIRYAIDSALRQTYKNFELIIVDDCSTDNTREIVTEYTRKHNMIKLYKSDINCGAYGCRNIALKNATGIYITLLDADDILYTNHIEASISNYVRNEKCEILFSNIYRIQTPIKPPFNDKTISNHIKKEREQYLTDVNNEWDIRCPWIYRFRLGLPTIFVSKSFFDKYGKWNEKYRYGMDIELVQRYIVIKYGQYIDNNSLFAKISNYGCTQWDILLCKYMTYASLPMNDLNATNICKGNNREQIHSECNDALNRLLKTVQENKKSNINI